MIFQQYYLGCLSHASYLIGDESSGRAVVVDPQRDVSGYLDDARRHGLRIERVIETHIHADFVSGHLELAALTGARIGYGAAAQVDFPVDRLQDGDRLSLGEVELEVRSTPGHTPESVSIVVHEHHGDAVPFGVLTGDTLFIGDVGRPDLLASEGESPERMARQLYRSLHGALLTLPDDTRVYPAHGAGSACGKNLSTETSSTIGVQRSANYALQLGSEDDFVAFVTDGQPARPAYFSFDSRRNRQRHPLLSEQEAPRPLTLDEVQEMQRAGAVTLDTRSPADFAAGHLRGALNVGLQGRFAEYAGDVIAPEQPIVLVCDPGTELEARVRLARIGFDTVAGHLHEPVRVLLDHPTLATVGSRLTARELAARLEQVAGLVVVDVRNVGELERGVIPGSRHIPLAALVERLDELDPAVPTVVHCASGYRSSIAASLLAARGFGDVSDLIGGYEAWSAATPAASAPGALDAAPTLDPDRARTAALEAGLVMLSGDPLNCETSIPALVAGVMVPNAHFYVRNHFRIPALDPSAWRLSVVGLVERPLSLRLDELHAMPAHSRTVTLECAGNGRSAFDPAVPGEQWGLGAVSTAVWSGVLLVDVLDRAGVGPAGRVVVFRGADGGAVEGRTGITRFERSLTLEEVRDSEALLAYAMNGERLPIQHGYPLRVVVPGWYAVTAVKWLTEIAVVDRPFEGYFQTDRYVYRWEREGRTVAEPVTLQRVRSVITEPATDSEVEAGGLTIRGVAWSGAAPIAQVEVRIGDSAWQRARLVGAQERGSWQGWELITRVDRCGATILQVRATDLAGRTQPERADWNALGYGNNAIQAVTVRVR